MKQESKEVAHINVRSRGVSGQEKTELQSNELVRGKLNSNCNTEKG